MRTEPTIRLRRRTGRNTLNTLRDKFFNTYRTEPYPKYLRGYNIETLYYR